MKKILAGVAGVSLVTVAGLMTFAGKAFNDELEQALVHLAQDPRLQRVEADLDRGWLRSKGQLTLDYLVEPGVELRLLSNWQARHRPGWVTFQGESLLRLVEEGQESLDLLEQVQLPPLAFSGRAGSQRLKLEMPLASLAVSEPDLRFNLTGGLLQLSYEFASGRQQGAFTVDQLRLDDGRRAAASLVLQRAQLNWDQQGEYPWMSGDLTLKADLIEYQGPEGEVQLTGPYLTQQLSLNPEQFDLSVSLTTGQVTSYGQTLGHASVQLSTQDFLGQPMADLLEIYNHEGGSLHTEEALAPVFEALDRLLAGSPGLLLDQFEVNLKTPFAIQQEAEGSLRFDGRNLPARYLTRLNSGEISDEDFASRLRIELLFGRLNPELLMLLGIPAFMQDATAEQQQLLWEKGDLLLNGQRLPF